MPDNDLEIEISGLINKTPNMLTNEQIAQILALEGGRRIAMKHILRKLKRSRRPKSIVHREIIPFLKLAQAKAQGKEKGKTKGNENGKERATPFRALPAESPSFAKTSRPRRPLPGAPQKTDTTRIGLFLNRQGHGVLVPCHRKDTSSTVRIELQNFPDIPHNHVVVYRLKPDNQVHIEKVLGAIDDPKTYSLMAIHTHNLPHVFTDDALKLAKKATIPPLAHRADFRDLPLVTIDGEDAKDFDDAVWSTPDTDPRNPGGWRAIVAIADVAYYVQGADALDINARERGNSVYFADRVVPMLPEALSNEMCSLKPDQDRACLAVEMIISADGKIKSHHFKRGLMRSTARLTYNQMQSAIKGDFDDVTGPLWTDVLQPLYGVYQSLLKARQQRGTLDLNVTERRVIFDDQGHVIDVKPRDRFDSHQLIEELMIAANVCAAKTLLAKNMPTLFRVHDKPEATRVENLRTVLKSLKIPAPKVKVFAPANFQAVLSQVQGAPYQQLVNDLVLRSQAQASYSPQNIGHFGLSLAHYCHFTSPIRRYADLIVHRGLIATLSLGEGGHDYALDMLETIGTHISTTERTAAVAEREVNDRLMTAFLETHLGEVFQGTIVGVTGVGVFISLNKTGAQGFIPKSRLGGDFYIYDADRHQYRGERTKKVYQLGQAVTVRLMEADSITCSTTFSFNVETSPRKTEKRKVEKAKPEKSFKKIVIRKKKP
ncbi:ribonuclease R [Candidatus Finniella inopinata]|uniref:Ribonuclease R n=1 Tax=Candidatus Finniella inopinata TaxID=1696036 RepID=A0A4Q7DJY4_9PROT|nr:ribonuclease R [Candidatus Finniella inopinata]RZI46485.1 ribonuclease R [Candidatus Finniella inopinata]